MKIAVRGNPDGDEIRYVRNVPEGLFEIAVPFTIMVTIILICWTLALL